MLARNTNTRTTVDDVLADNRWMTVSEQCGSLSIQLTPLLAERLDATQHTAGMALLIGSPTSGELSDHLKATSSDGDILLNVDPRTKVLHVACPTLARHVGTEDHCPGDNIEWARVSDVRASQSLAAIYSRLLGPFTHVVCVFASSFTSTAEIGTFLSTWLRSAWSGTQVSNSSSASAYSMPHDLLVPLPRLIVLTEEKSFPSSEFLESLKASLEAIVFEQTGFFLNKAFSSFTVKDTSTEACLLRQRRYTKLTALLASECAAARRTFERLNMLYHTHTMVDLFSRAYHCLLNNEVFNPVAASRAWSPVPPNAAQQIVRFLSEHKDEETLRTFALPYLVSAIRASAYPAEAHPFDFPLIFDTLYKSIWHHAARTVCLETDMYLLVENMVRDPVNTVVAVDNDGTTTHVRTVKSMSRLNSTNSQHTMTFVDSESDDKGNDRQTQPKKAPTGRFCQEGNTVDLDTPMSSHERRHLLFLATSRDRWRSHKVHDYCPACILRRPEYGLPCGHMYCENDIRRLGRKIGRETYAVEECTCCQARFTDVVFKFRPKTKGIRVLALDGGGVRGGICALTLAHKGMSVKKAIQDFTDLSQRVFVSQPIWARAFNLIARGSIYGSSAIDEALKRHYGESKLSDYTPATARAAKILVTVKGTPKGDHILSNFNGVGLDNSHKDFEQTFCHPDDEEGQKAILAWEAARSTSAAPVIFPTFTIDGVGTFQDGAMWRNNPADVALSLVPALTQGHCLPDILLSIGTGFEKRLQRGHREPQPPTRVTIPLIDLLRRLYAFMGDNIVTDGEKFHNHIMAGRSDVGSRFRRLNVPLSEGYPSLDDASSIPRLMDEAAAHFKSHPGLQEVLDSIISSFFYFEVSSRPIRHRTHVSFCGRILCDIQPGHRLKHFIKDLRIRGAEFSINGKFTALDSVGEWNGREVDFEIPVRGTVAGLHTRLEIFLCWNMLGRQSKEMISRSPFSLNEIMEAQGWDSPQSRALRQPVRSGRKRGIDCHAAWKRITKARR
ncbi:hypothetical protein Focb16_v005608 [Fusarium oxysporum f. sp. cubense]|uniref:PNPLA domain-containing protein n=1 Tax=Fusarium oxysporum f. sp. cubense TaxID=61366 RepID=A0A559LKW0_FUSOC|nr:hypothetical protein Focb16_v005608 [Fusarium oxysporum f. sp. cubense]